MQKILDYIDENGKITDLEIQELLGLKKNRAFTLAKQMRDERLIKVIGRGSQKIAETSIKSYALQEYH